MLSGKDRIRSGALKSAAIQKARKAERIVIYSKNPSCCAKCQTPIPYSKRTNKYCSRSCSISVNNRGTRRHGQPPKIHSCKMCNQDTANKTFCSKKCQFNGAQSRAWDLIKSGKYKCNSANSQTLRKFLVIHRGSRCEKCGLSHWVGETLPLTLHHKNGDAYDNHLSNLELLCWNCHALTKNFGGKNKNGTRKYRYQDKNDS